VILVLVCTFTFWWSNSEYDSVARLFDDVYNVFMM